MASVDELWLVDLGPAFPGEPAAIRPALVIGPADTFGPRFPYVILVPLTTSWRDLPLHVEIDATRASGLDRTSYAQCELFRAVTATRLIHRLGTVDIATSRTVDRVIRTLLNH
jgi:mRNA interferase MazF